MTQCPLCHDDLNLEPKLFRPPGGVSKATLYDCPHDGSFALRLTSDDLLISHPIIIEKIQSYLRLSSDKNLMFDVYLDDKGKDHVICKVI